MNVKKPTNNEAMSNAERDKKEEELAQEQEQHYKQEISVNTQVYQQNLILLKAKTQHQTKVGCKLQLLICLQVK